MEDRIIINLFWQRDQNAIEETDNKYGETCRYIARSILTSREDAEECVDDTYMAVWDSIPPQRPVHLSAFLYRIVRNLSFNRLKERYTQKRGGGELVRSGRDVDENVQVVPVLLVQGRLYVHYVAQDRLEVVGVPAPHENVAASDEGTDGLEDRGFRDGYWILPVVHEHVDPVRVVMCYRLQVHVFQKRGAAYDGRLPSPGCVGHVVRIVSVLDKT